MTNKPKKAAIDAAKARRRMQVKRELSNGVKVCFRAVAPALIEDVQNRIEDPVVPTVYIESKGREEPNPSDPDYVRALAKAEHDRTLAALEAMVVFGVEIIERPEVPESWFKGLKRLGIEVDRDDPDELDYALKRYGLSSTDLADLVQLSQISPKDVDKFTTFFPGDQARGADQ